MEYQACTSDPKCLMGLGLHQKSQHIRLCLKIHVATFHLAFLIQRVSLKKCQADTFITTHLLIFSSTHRFKLQSRIKRFLGT